MTILITGASGLIGRSLAERLRGRHDLVCQSRTRRDNTPDVEWIQHDLATDSWDVLAGRQIDVVYHLAGQTSTYKARNDPRVDLSVNVLGFLGLLDQLKRQARAPFVVLAGTATEIGLSDVLPIHEGLPDRPVTFYDLSKLTAERYLAQYVREQWLGGCTLRLGNVFGRSQPGQQADRGIIDKIFQQAVAGRAITMYGDGRFLRDYIFIDDVIAAFVHAAEQREQTNGRTFYIGSGQGTTLKEAFTKVIDLAAGFTGLRVELQEVTPPPGLSEIEGRNAVIDSSAFRQATGWKPEYNFDSGLQAAFREFAAHLR